MRSLLTLLLALLLTLPSRAQKFNLEVNEMPRFIDSLFNKGMDDRLLPGAIIGLVSQGEVIHRGAYGYAKVQAGMKVDFDQTLFQLGSVGKLMTSIAVLKEVEAGRLDLNKDVNEYLREFKIDAPEENPVTLHHLLTHTAGFNERIIGYARSEEDEVESLGDHLKRRMPSLFTAPGKEISYSNYGFGLAGHLVELSSGKSFKEYIKTEILDVLDMNRTTYELPKDETSNFAIGYQVRDEYNPSVSFSGHVTPAGGIVSTGNDLLKWIQALLSQDNQLLSSENYRFLTEQLFTPHELIAGHGYGIETQNLNGHLGIGKAGNIPGFIAYLMLFPQYDFGMFVVVNTETDNFLEGFNKAFKDRFFPDLNNSLKEVKPISDLSPYAGDFRANRYNRNTIEDLFGLLIGSTTIYNQNDSALVMFHNGDWQYYKPIEELVFQNTTDASMYLVYEKHENQIAKMHRNVLIGGYSIPITLEKIPWYGTVNFVNEHAAFFPLIVLSYLLFPIGWLIVLLIRRRKSDYMKGKGFGRVTRTTLVSFCLLTLISSVMFAKLVKLGRGLIFGIPQDIVFLQYFSYLIPVVLIILVYRLFKVWNAREGMLGSRIYLSIYVLAAITYTLILHQWHFIGLNF